MPWYPVEVYEQHYLGGANPRAQSGFGGDERRWQALRRPIADAIDAPGSFLDVGCANGYLLECLLRWSPHPIDPCGLDFSARLIELARMRLPHGRFFVGDALEWEPPYRFEFVRTELVYAPDGKRDEFVARLRGWARRLIVCSYGSGRRGQPAEPLGVGPESVVEDPEGGGAALRIAILDGS